MGAALHLAGIAGGSSAGNQLALGLCRRYGGLGAALCARRTDRLKEDGASDPAPLKLLDYPALFLAGISGLIPFIALSGSWIGFWVGALLVYSILDSLEGLLPLFKRA